MQPSEKHRQIVVDASVGLSWCYEDEDSPYADRILSALREGCEAAVPTLWKLELANSLVISERKNRITDTEIAESLSFIDELPIIVDHFTPDRAFGETLRLARAHNLSTYDAAYIELSYRLDASLATLDKKMQEVAKKEEIPIFH